MANYSTLELINGYENDSEENNGKFISKVLSGSVKHRRKSGKKRSKYRRIIRSAAIGLRDRLLYASLRTYGVFLLSFGLLTLLSRFAVDYLFGQNFSLETMIIGAVVALLGVPLLIFDKPVSIALQDFAPTDYLLFEFFGIKRTPKRESPPGIHAFVGLLFGAALAALGFLVPVKYLVFGLCAAVYFCFAMVSPEFSFFGTILFMPCLTVIEGGGVFLCVPVTVTLLSFVIKVINGKRAYHFEQYDALIFVFMLLVLISGTFVKGFESFTSSVTMVLLAVGYVTSSSLISNRRLAENLFKSVIVSAVPLSVAAIAKGIKQLVENGGFSGYRGVGVGEFSSEALAVFLLVCAVFTVYFFIASSSASEAVTYGLLLLVIAAAMLATFNPFVIFAAVFGVCAYFLSKLRRASGILIALLCLFPYSIIFLPPEWFAATDSIPVLSSLGLYGRAQMWRNSLRMFADNLFIGVGVGKESFNTEINEYVQSSATDSGNLFLEIGVEAGVFALAALILIFIVRARHRTRYRGVLRESRVDRLSSVTVSATVCMIVFGVVNYLWSNPTLVYLFWCVFGASSALLRTARNEYDDMVDYFSDARSFDTSSVDIRLR